MSTKIAQNRLSPLESAVDRYLLYLESELGQSPLTVTNYTHQLNDFLGSTSVKSPFKIDKTSIRQYKQYLHRFKRKNGKELTVRTKNHRLTVLRAFLRYLVQEEELNVYPPDRVQRFKEDPRQVKVLFSEDMERLLAAPNAATPIGKRDRAILELFFSTGLRVSELRSLNRNVLNFKTREISVRGKRGKIRLVFLSDRSVDALKNYLNSRIDHLSPLFIRHLSKTANVLPPGEEFRLSRISIYNIVKKYALQSGIVTNPSPHTLRHSFATNLLQMGADIRSVQELLGHKDLSTTQIYTHVTNPQLKEVHRKYHRLK